MNRVIGLLCRCLLLSTGLWLLSGLSSARAIVQPERGPAPSAVPADSVSGSWNAPGASRAATAHIFTRFPVDTTEMVGAKVGEEGAEFELLELVWGINARNEVCVAQLVVRDGSGVVYEKVSAEPFNKLTTATADLAGAYMQTDGGHWFLVGHIQYAINGNGALVVAQLDSIDSQGFAQSLSFFGSECCALRTAFPCSQGTCQPPALCYGYTSCPCPSSGACGVTQITGCRGGCPGGEPRCTGVCSNSIFDCRCY